MNIVVEDPKVRPGGALYIRKNIFSVSCVVNKAKDMAKSTPVGGGRNPAANGRVCRWFLLRLFRSAHAMPKGMRACQRVPSFSIVVWETPSTTLPGAYTRAPRTQPLGFCFSLLPKPNQTPGEQGSWRAARFAAQVRSAQHGASGQKRRLALHSMVSGTNTMAICGQRFEKIGRARRAPLGREKERRLVFLR